MVFDGVFRMVGVIACHSTTGGPQGRAAEAMGFIPPWTNLQALLGLRARCQGCRMLQDPLYLHTKLLCLLPSDGKGPCPPLCTLQTDQQLLQPTQ